MVYPYDEYLPHDDRWNRVIVSLAFEFLLIAVLAIWWCALLPRVFSTYIVPSCKKWFKWWRERELRTGIVPDAEKRVRDQIDRRRLERLRTIVMSAFYPITIVELYALVSAVVDASMMGSDFGETCIVGLNAEGLFVSLLCLWSLSFPKTAERFLTLRVLDFVLLLLFVSVGLHTLATAARSQSYIVALNQSVTVQMILSMCLGNSTKVGIANLINLGVQILVLNLPVHPDGRPSDVTRCYYAEDNMLWRFAWNALFTQIASWMVQGALRAEAEASVRELEASRSEKTAADLLSVMCDAVVALRKNFTLRDPCPRLHALLLREQRVQAGGAEDVPFQRYLPEADQERFKSLLQQSSGAGTFHAHLLGGFDQKVAVQIFHTSWTDADDEVNYLLGLQEEQDVEEPFARSYREEAAVSSAPIEEIGLRDLGGSDDRHDEMSACSEHSGGSVTRSDASVISMWSDVPVYCRVKLGLTLDIKEQSEECATLFGFGPGDDNLLSRLSKAETDTVLSWLQDLYLTQALHVEKKKEHAYGIVTLQNSNGVTYKVKLSALKEKKKERTQAWQPVTPAMAAFSEVMLVLSPSAPSAAPTDSSSILRRLRSQSRGQHELLQERAAAASTRLRGTPVRSSRWEPVPGGAKPHL